MRRLLSIAIATALMCSLLSPIIAAASEMNECPMMKNGECLRLHLALMAYATQDQASFTRTKDFNCPANCLLADSGKQTTAAVPVIRIPELAADRSVVVAANCVFVRTGHSSYTDRGPPSI
jgi:hypothetical protein